MKRLLLVGMAVMSLGSASWAGDANQDGNQQTPQASSEQPPAQTVNYPNQFESIDPKILAGKNDITDPNQLPINKQIFCINHILNTINNKYQSRFTPADVIGFKLLNNGAEYFGFPRGGGYNVHILARNVPANIADRIKPGRKTDLINTLFKGGMGASLHIENKFDNVDNIVSILRDRAPNQKKNETFFNITNSDGTHDIEFFAHIDSAYALEIPTGTAKHYFVDVRGWKTRNPCPGKDEMAKKAVEAYQDGQARLEKQKAENP